MMSKLWSGKGAALAVAGAAGAVLVAYVSLTLASPEQVSSAGLGPGWQCSRVAFVLTTCTRAGEAEREAASCVPRGHLTVNSNIPFGMLHVMPLLPRFMREHPDITLDVVLTDTLVDLMQARADVAIRAGPLGASRLIARKLGTSRMAVVAAPSYLARHGIPKTPADLAAHRGIGWTFPRSIRGWPFRRAEKIEEALPPPVARASDGETARQLTLGGIGVARLALFHIGPDIEAGRLVPVLQNLNPGDREDIHAVYVGHAGPLPARVRAFIDFLASNIRIGDPALRRGADGKWKIVGDK